MRSILHLIVLSFALFAGSAARAEQKVFFVSNESTMKALQWHLDHGWRITHIATAGWAWAYGGGGYGSNRDQGQSTVFVLESPPPPPPLTASEAKASALSKLTPSERAALGLEASTPIKD